MANLDQKGFHPEMNVGSTSTQVVRRRTASNNGTAIFTGDCLKRTAAGVWGIATAAAGVSGVCQGASFFSSAVNGRIDNTFLPVSTTYTATVFDDYGNTDQSFLYVTADPVNTRFRTQYSASTPALTDLTKNANFTAATAGSVVTGISGHQLDQTTLATTAALDLTVVDIKHNVQNDFTATGAKVIVQLNLGAVPPFNADGTAGV